MEKKEDLEKLHFALEYLKSGCNAAAAARAVGKSRSWGSRHKDDAAVKAYIAEIMDAVKPEAAADEKAEISAKIADTSEILETLTLVLRRESCDTNIVTLRSREGRTEEETYEKLEIPAKLSDVLRAADLMIKYYQSSKPESGGEGTGVIFLPE